jgi:NADH-quinone oxidoreductase subunit K
MNIISLNFILTVSLLIFFIGLAGLITIKKNVLVTLMSIELMLLGINLNFLIFSLYLDDLSGHIFILFILTISATESVIGLALITVYFRLKGSIDFDLIKHF